MTREQHMTANTARFRQIEDKYSADYLGSDLYFKESFDKLLITKEENPERGILEEKPFTGVKQIIKKFAGDYIQNSMQNECMLNFASAKYPGGGVRYGSIAQEEDICRNTLLYFYINHYRDRYENKDFVGDNEILNENFIIYSSTVPTVKSNLSLGHENDYITSAAPDLRFLGNDPITLLAEPQFANIKRQIQNVWVNRIKAVLAVAKLHKAENLVLGPWGCGVFMNDPHFVFFCFDHLLKKYGGNFRRITFLAPDDKNYEIFKKYVS